MDDVVILSPRSTTKIEARKTTYFDKPPNINNAKKHNSMIRSKTVTSRPTSPRKHTDSEREYDSYVTPDSLSSGDEKVRLERLDAILSRRSPRRRIRYSESLNTRKRRLPSNDFTATNAEFLKLLEQQKKQSAQIKALQQQLEKQSKLIQLQNELLMSSSKQHQPQISVISKLQEQITNEKIVEKPKKRNSKKKNDKKENNINSQKKKKNNIKT